MNRSEINRLNKQRLQQQAHEAVLVLSCEPTIAMKWLIPRLPAFHAAHPDIQLHLAGMFGNGK